MTWKQKVVRFYLKDYFSVISQNLSERSQSSKKYTSSKKRLNVQTVAITLTPSKVFKRKIFKKVY